MTKDELEIISLVVNSIVGLTGIITLLFLLWQTLLLKKQLKIANKESELANRLAKNQAYQFRYQLYLEMDKIMIESPELKQFISNEAFHKLYKNNGIDDKRARSLAFMELVMNLCQLSFFQYKDELNEGELNWVKEVIQNENIIEYWKSDLRCKYRADFADFVNNTMDDNLKTT